MVRTGDLDRLTPFSTAFGYDRGGPIDRFYIESFLQREAGAIGGKVLEIGDATYTFRFGKEQVKQSDVLHVNPLHPGVTLTGDLAQAPQIPDDTFDCIILTQTLHLIYHYQDAIKTCYRILKPGGTLLLTVPGITPIDHGEWEKNWYWSFTRQSLHKIMTAVFPEEQVTVESFGNVFIATAFLFGMGLPEVEPAQLHHNDPHYPVIITIRATKPVEQ